ncbi:unnamed protein product, partial [Ixodes hexagonus]
QVDPAGINHVGALEAAAFLKRSGLPDGVLSKIWDLADAGGKGFLDKRGFFVALKLVALVQSGKPPSTAQLGSPAPPPCMADQMRGGSVDWSIKPLEHSKYVEMFNSLGPIAGKLPGSKVKPVMLNSKLPVDVLGKIWDLSDVDQDGALDEEEFIVAMHLVYKALDNCPIPSVLPAELMPRSKQSGRPLVPGLPPDFSTDTLGMRRRPSTPSSVGAVDVALHNVSTAQEKYMVFNGGKIGTQKSFVRSRILLDRSSLDRGLTIRNPIAVRKFPAPKLKSLSMKCFAQFATCCRSNYTVADQYFGLDGDRANVRIITQSEKMKSAKKMPLLALYIPSGSRNRSMVCWTVFRLRAIRSFCISARVVKRLGEFRVGRPYDGRRVALGVRSAVWLEDLATDLFVRQVSTHVERTVHVRELHSTSKKVEPASASWFTVPSFFSLQEQERELEQKRAELKGLCQEECGLQAEIDSKKAQLLALGQTQQDTQLQISQVKAKQVALEEQHVQLKTWVSQVDRALQAGDPGLVPESLLRDEQFLSGLPEPEYQQLSNTDGSSHSSFVSVPEDEIKEDPFKSKDPFSDMNGFMGDPFAGEDPFQAADPFKSTAADDPFAGDPFKSAFSSEPKEGDYFAAGFEDASSAAAVKDPFDPFGLGKPAAEETNVMADADPFGTDPFAPPSATAPRAESPTPALPPKKGKNPPPRPAPPKHLAGNRGPTTVTGPTRAAPAPPLPDDPFASTGGGSATESFANFADFGDC